jgi:DNA polymerase-4
MLVRLLGIRFTQLVPGNYQINLFEDTQEMIRLYQSIDHIKHRFGEGSLMRAKGLESLSSESHHHTTFQRASIRDIRKG